MPARAGPASQEGYPSSSPSFDAHSNDPFNNSQGRRYYDNESDHVEFGGRRDYRETYASDASHLAGNEYDNNGNYEYGVFTAHIFVLSRSLGSLLFHQLSMIQTLTLKFMVNVQHPRQSP